MSQSIVCVWCSKPLLDVDHAKKHVAEQCEVAPWRKQIKELADALVGLRYKPDPTEPNAPARFCDHAAEPCDRCGAVRVALKNVGRE